MITYDLRDIGSDSLYEHLYKCIRGGIVHGVMNAFILMFLVVVGINSLGFISDALRGDISKISKFLMTTSLAAIGLDTNFKEVSKSGFLPMLHGFIISALVVVVSFVDRKSVV